MEQTPEEFQGPQSDEPQRVNGWLSIGFVAAFGGVLLAIGLVALLSAHVPGVGQFAFVIAGGAMLLVAARSAIRTYGKGNALLIVVLAGGVGGCFGASLAPDHGGAVPIRAQCQNNLKQIGLVVAIYASEHPAHLAPPLSNTPGRLMFSNAPDEVIRIYPDILTDLSLFYCPESEAVPASPTPETAIDDHTYFYLGYEIRNQMDLERFAAAYREVIAEGGTFESELPVAGAASLPRITRESIAARPELSEIPLLIERPLAHIPGGSNVLFADGHVEFIKMNTKWPVTQAAMDVLLSLDALGP